jgi:endonuclease YncB( thermonuclease family)
VSSCALAGIVSASRIATAYRVIAPILPQFGYDADARAYTQGDLCHGFLMRDWIAGLVLILTSPVWAAEPTVSDGDTLTVDGTKYRLDGIDAPEFNQICLDEKDQEWKCGLAARDALVEWIAKRTVRCDDKGPDKVHPDRRIGICFVEGKELNEWLVRQGWALNFEPYAKGRYLAAQRDAKKTTVECGRGALLHHGIFGAGKRTLR